MRATSGKCSGSWRSSGLRPLILLPAFTRGLSHGLANWGVVSSYSSATASGFHGVPSIESLTLNSQRSARRLALANGLQQGFNYQRGAFFAIERHRKALHVFHMFAAAALVLFTIIYRVVLGIAGSTHLDWLHNFSPLAAIALCGAVYFPRRVAVAGPLLALLISDVILNAHYHAPLLTWDILPRYLALAAIAGFGWLLRSNPRAILVLGSSLTASVVFFIVTNTGSWLAEPGYAKTAAGWTQAMTAGLPGFPSTLVFFRNTVLSDLLFTGLFLACIVFQGRREGTPQPTRRHELAPW